MEYVDRIALIVRPKRRFMEWANNLDQAVPLTPDELHSLETVVLLAAPDDAAAPDLQAIIDIYAGEIFEQMLEAWHTDESAWPANRTPRMFRDWFDARLIEEVWDADDDDAWFDLPPELECGWCGAPVDPDAESLTLSFKVDDRTLIKGLPPGPTRFPLGDRTVTAVIPGPDSEAAQEADLVFAFCGDTCADVFTQRWEELARQKPS